MDRDREPPPFDGSVPPPEWANIETTKFCNLRCRMCVQFHDGTTVAGPSMELAEFERIARTVFPYVHRWQPTVSGEPVMSRGFEEMLAIAEEFGVKAEAFTNGTLLSDKMIARLAPNLASLSISFDGAAKDTFEWIRDGADYDVVKQNVRRLADYCRAHLPPDKRPLLGLNCTIMRRNIEELPALVRLARDELGLHQLNCYHVFPITAEMREQSLVHHQELARRCIDAALALAAELDFTVRVEALDQLTAATALGPGEKRVYAERDGVVAGLELREYRSTKPHREPRQGADDDADAAVRARRAAARAASGLPQRRPGDPDAAGGESIWWCDFLWNRTYVAVGGHVRPCCIYGIPAVGNLLDEPFEQVWNNEAYRALRQRLAAKAPAPACRGCLHIREITDPVRIDELLLGARPPRASDLGPLPAALDPAQAPRRRAGEPPVLTWAPVAGAFKYVVDFSLDGFASLLFTTDGPGGGPAIREPRYAVPGWAWRDAPVDHAIHYRVVAHTAHGEREVLRAVMPREA